MKITPRRHRPSIALLASLGVLAGLGLAACGGSSPSVSSGASTAKNADSSSRGKAGSTATNPASSSRFAAYRECLQRNGITLPSRRATAAGAGTRPAGGSSTTPGGTTPGGPPPRFGGRGHFLQGLASGERAKYEAALRKCGSLAPFRGRGFANRNPAGLTRFAACMRKNGVKLPKPNTSGNGPVFSTKGLDRNSSTFKSAQSKCRGELGFPAGRPPGGGPPGGDLPGGGYPGGGPPPAEG